MPRQQICYKEGVWASRCTSTRYIMVATTTNSHTGQRKEIYSCRKLSDRAGTCKKKPWTICSSGSLIGGVGQWSIWRREIILYTFISRFGVLRYICNFSVCTISAMMINIEMVTFTQSVSGFNVRSSLKFFFCTGQMFRRTEQALERP